MSRHDDILAHLGKCTIFGNNIGFGEQGAILTKMPKSISVCPDIEKARMMKSQLDALHRECVVIDDFERLFTVSKYQSHENRQDMIYALYKLTTSNTILISTPNVFFLSLYDIMNFKKHILSLNKTKDYDLSMLIQKLVSLGYKKVDIVSAPGEFSHRGDIIDIFNIHDKNPIRLDFFDTELDKIYSFDFVTFEHLDDHESVDILPNRLTILSAEDKKILTNSLSEYKNLDNTIFDILDKIDRDEDVPIEFIYPFVDNVSTVCELNIPIIISNAIQVENIYNKNYDNITEKLNNLFINEKLNKIYKNSKKYLKLDDFYTRNQNNLIFFDNFDFNTTNIKNKFNNFVDIDFNTINFPNFLFNLESLQINLTKYKDKQIYLCLSSIDTMNSIKKIFTDTNVKFSINKNDTGLILTELNIPYNICFADQDKLYIGSTNFAHKKEAKKESKQTIKYLPKAGEYVVHSTHGIAKCEGIVTVNVSGVDKEFFKLVYRDGDNLYVPYENADCLSLYMADGEGVRLNKLGGKEFATQKLKAIKSIEDMSQELLELYAKRKATKGFVYPEDDYLYTEFENAFEYTETADQLQAIADIKRDMQTGKVMDRLICGDVGFGKTEVAMRALFKAVEAGKQVAILAPTTILSLQHYMTVSNRTKQFGVVADMLNRFKSSKEQKQILEDLSTGKINVICGTHRLLSSDVKFNDLGLLILDEEQRFGVKAKEQIKQLKNNVDVLTLSATPIPRTLSMSLMSIRDISIINSPPVNRLPVKTYVMGYNEEFIVNAINDELNRDGQVLIVYNNVDGLPILANRLKGKVSEKARFDIAHGQMSEIALENAIKRLYDHETNVFVSTTLIENGVDLPKANTLIVIDSDKLGLSQMYQLRGRVGRNTDQAYAFFTYNKEKVLTEDSTSRLQAIAEHTELGSGFKIAMRDLQIRGAGELLGKVQHGHMIKIGYDMYSKLLNDTLRRLKGEKVDIDREVKLDIALPSKIPTSFIDDESERLKIIAKISNIQNKEDARKVINELLGQLGKLPKEIYHLTNIALLKALAIKNKIKLVTITKNKISMMYYDDIDLKALMAKVNKYAHFRFDNAALPTISLDPSSFSVQTSLSYIIEFLNG